MLAVMALGAIYGAGVNKNALYLSLLGSLAVLFSLILNSWWSVVLELGVCVYLAAVPAKFAEARFLDPMPHGPSDSPWYSMLEPGEKWNYDFTLQDLAKYRGRAHLTGYLRIDGVQLSDLEVAVHGKALSDISPPKIIYNHEYLAVPINEEDAPGLQISLQAKPGTKVKIFCGPEAYEHEMYSDAVWLEFANARESVLYHAKRVMNPTTNP